MKRILPILVLLLLASQTRAGVYVLATGQKPGGKPAAAAQVLLSGDRVRLDIQGPYTDGTLLYDKSTGAFYAADHFRKGYFDLNEQERERLKSLLPMALRANSARMLMADSEEKKMYGSFKLFVSGLFGLTFQKKIPDVRLGRWTCDKYQGDRDAAKVSDLWVVPWGRAGLTAGEAETFGKFLAILKDLSKDAVVYYGADGAKFDTWPGFSGVPVSGMWYEDHKAKTSVEVRQMEKRDFKAEAFTVPEGYKKLDFLDLLTGGL